MQLWNELKPGLKQIWECDPMMVLVCLWLATLLAGIITMVQSAIEKRRKKKAMQELLYSAWCVISNVAGGNWAKESSEWQRAAENWRDKYHRRNG